MSSFRGEESRTAKLKTSISLRRPRLTTGRKCERDFLFRKKAQTNSLSDPALGERRSKNKKGRRRSSCCQPVSRLLNLPSHLKYGRWQQKSLSCRWLISTELNTRFFRSST